MFDKILLAVDSSPHSAKAADAATELAKLSNAEVLVCHVRAPLTGRAGHVDVDLREQDDNIAEGIARSLEERGVKATASRVAAYYGDTAQRIVEAASAVGAEGIVMGSRGHSDLPNLLFCSVTHKVLHLATRPVLVVR